MRTTNIESGGVPNGDVLIVQYMYLSFFSSFKQTFYVFQKLPHSFQSDS